MATQLPNVRFDASPELLDRLAEIPIFLKWRSDGDRKLPRQFAMGENDHIEPYAGFYQGGNFCTMGAFSYSHSPVQPGMSIGRYCALSWGLQVTGPRHPYEWLTVSNLTYDRNAPNVRAYLDEHPNAIRFRDARRLEHEMPNIGHDVWIGQNVKLNRGIRVNNGAVIAAFSTVTKDVPPYAIVGGNPAKIIKYRFTDRQIASLADLHWWDYEPKDFMDLDIENIDTFINEFGDRRPELQPYWPERQSSRDLERMAGGAEAR